MVEAHAPTAATRRGSNPRLEEFDPAVIDIPPTPPNKSNASSAATFFSLLLPFSSSASDGGGAAAASGTMTTTFMILAWYMSNIGTLIVNKYLLSVKGYRYPIFLTALHMTACSAYSAATVRLRLTTLQPLASRRQFLKIAALGAIFCFSVVCGNTSLRYIPVSFNQAIGATTPFFTAVFALAITCRREQAPVYAALVPVVLGIMLATMNEPLFHAFGFLVCLGSTAGRALKSVVQGILLTSEAERLNSMNLLLYMAPIAGAILLPLALWMEPGVVEDTFSRVRADPGLAALLVLNASMAYLVNLTNFLVTKHTSALTLQVLGNAKSAVAALVSVLVFRNPVTVMGVTGFGITLVGVWLYSQAKKRCKLSSSSSSSSSSSTSSGLSSS